MDGVFGFDITLTAAFCNGQVDCYTCVCTRACFVLFVGLLPLS